MKIKDILTYLVLYIIILLMLFGINVLGNSIVKDYSKYSEYKNFCLEKPSFCYCEFGGCEYNTKSSQSCLNGNCSEYILSNDTKELCILANKLNDKKMMFKIGC